MLQKLFGYLNNTRKLTSFRASRKKKTFCPSVILVAFFKPVYCKNNFEKVTVFAMQQPSNGVLLWTTNMVHVAMT